MSSNLPLAIVRKTPQELLERIAYLAYVLKGLDERYAALLQKNEGFGAAENASTIRSYRDMTSNDEIREQCVEWLAINDGRRQIEDEFFAFLRALNADKEVAPI